MPKLYEYFGLVIFFYSNEHEPVHVHGSCQGHESKAEIIIQEGVVLEVIYSDVPGKPPLDAKHLADFKAVVEFKALDIVQHWVDYFINHRRSHPEIITRRLK